MKENLKIISPDRIEIEKISDDNNPFNITYSITLKEVESHHKERTVFFSDSKSNKTELKAFIEEGYVEIPDINFKLVIQFYQKITIFY